MRPETHSVHLQTFMRPGLFQHRRLTKTLPLTVTLTNGTTRDFAKVLSDVIVYWRDNYFA
jgi:hypothetical protein